MNQVCKVLDNYILDQDIPFWYVRLNNQEVIYQDDNRSGLLPSAWDRLCSYCKMNNLYIEKFWIRFRTNIVECASNKDAIWFRKGIMGGFGRDTSLRFKDINFFLVGYIENDENIMRVTKWRIPELVDWEKEDREIPKKDIIWNGDRKNRYK